jgi:hypothetical protein
MSESKIDHQDCSQSNATSRPVSPKTDSSHLRSQSPPRLGAHSSLKGLTPQGSQIISKSNINSHERPSLEFSSGFTYYPSHTLHICPRPSDTVSTEQAYLNGLLVSQGVRSVNLMRRMMAIEESLQSSNLSGIHLRKVQKKVGLLRHKLSQSIDQERSILNRLGELQVQVQYHDRLMQIHRERYEPGWWTATLPPIYYVPPILSGIPNTTASCWAVAPTAISQYTSPLNLSSANYTAPYSSLWTPIPSSFDHSASHVVPSPSYNDPFTQSTALGSQTPPRELPGLQYVYDLPLSPTRKGSTIDRRPFSSLVGYETQPPQAQYSRMSLPSLKFEWP